MPTAARALRPPPSFPTMPRTSSRAASSASASSAASAVTIWPRTPSGWRGTTSCRAMRTCSGAPRSILVARREPPPRPSRNCSATGPRTRWGGISTVFGGVTSTNSWMPAAATGCSSTRLAASSRGSRRGASPTGAAPSRPSTWLRSSEPSAPCSDGHALHHARAAAPGPSVPRSRARPAARRPGRTRVRDQGAAPQQAGPPQHHGRGPAVRGVGDGSGRVPLDRSRERCAHPGRAVGTHVARGSLLYVAPGALQGSAWRRVGAAAVRAGDGTPARDR